MTHVQYTGTVLLGLLFFFKSCGHDTVSKMTLYPITQKSVQGIILSHDIKKGKKAQD